MTPKAKSPYGMDVVDVEILNDAIKVVKDAGYTPTFIHATHHLDHFIFKTFEGPYIFVDACNDTWREATQQEHDYCWGHYHGGA